MKKNYIYAFISVLVWSTLAATVKMILSDIPNLEALSISSLFSFLFLLLVNLKNCKLGQLKKYSVKDYAIMCGLGFIGLFVYSVLYYYGLSQLSSQMACIINYLWPIMIVVFSCIILKEKMTVMKGFAMVCSFAGIVILSWGGTAASGENAVFGITACIVAAACYGLFSVLNKKADYDQGISMMIMWLVVALCAMIAGLATETWVPIKGAQWAGILWLGVVVDGLAYLLWALALSGTKNTAKIANIAYLTPFLSIIVSAVVLGEKVQVRAFVALVFIIGGILIQSLCEHKKAEK